MSLEFQLQERLEPSQGVMNDAAMNLDLSPNERLCIAIRQKERELKTLTEELAAMKEDAKQLTRDGEIVGGETAGGYYTYQSALLPRPRNPLPSYRHSPPIRRLRTRRAEIPSHVQQEDEMSLELRLQERLEESSVVMAAAEGLSPEVRMLTEFAEKKKALDTLTKEVKDMRDALLAHFEETGERPSNGTQILKVTPVETWEYDNDKIKAERPELFQMIAEIKAGKMTALLKAGLIKESELENYRTKTTAFQVSVEAVK